MPGCSAEESCAGLSIFVLFVLVIVALVRTRANRRLTTRLDQLEEDFRSFSRWVVGEVQSRPPSARPVEDAPPPADKAPVQPPISPAPGEAPTTTGLQIEVRPAPKTENTRIAAPPGETPPDVAPEPKAEPTADPAVEPPADTPPSWWRPEAGDQTPAEEIPKTVPPKKPVPPRKKIEWEQWVGVKGAAVLGGVALALAALLFFKYSIEHGLIPPTVRVILGTLVGLGAIVGAEWGMRRRYRITANALSGSGIVILYAAFWAAKALYGLVNTEVAFVLMGMATAAGGVLAVRHRSLLTALLGLVGGFATPLLLSTGEDRPFGLFGYVLLLDLGVFFVARKRGWHLLLFLSLLGTLLYQTLWIGWRMDSDRLALGLGILVVFAALFLVFGHFTGQEKRGRGLIVQAAAILFPFGFALYIGGSANFGPHIFPVGVLVLMLSIASCWIGRAQKQYWLNIATASATLAVVAVWLTKDTWTIALGWETTAMFVLLAVAYHVFVEWEPKRAGADGPAPGSIVSGLGLLLLLDAGALNMTQSFPWPCLVGWLALGALLIRHATFSGRHWLQLAAAAGLGLGLAIEHIANGTTVQFPPYGIFMGLLVTGAIAFQIVALVRWGGPVKKWAEHAAAFFGVFLILSLTVSPFFVDVDPAFALGGVLVLGVLVGLAAARSGMGAWLLGATAATALAQLVWWQRHFAEATPPHAATLALVLQSAAVLFFTGWPFLAANRLRHGRWAWYGAALAGPFWFFGLRGAFISQWGTDFIGILPVVLAAVSLSAAFGARRVWTRSQPLFTTALVWFSAVALGFVSVAIPLQLSREWITIGWALEGIAVLLLWRRIDHPGLKYFGLLLLGAVTIRLVANPAVLDYYPRSEWRILNWLSYTYLVPTIALVGSAWVLGRLELTRARSWELYYRLKYAWTAMATGLSAIVVGFVWINLTIADWFATGTHLSLSFERLPARDLATSISWALYALLLLALGMGRRSKGLRWTSLVLLLVTIGKVFLHDLGELKDLYRVFSLVGLALSLIIVSLGYQRFVFRDTPTEEKQ